MCLFISSILLRYIKIPIERLVHHIFIHELFWNVFRQSLSVLVKTLNQNFLELFILVVPMTTISNIMAEEFLGYLVWISSILLRIESGNFLLLFHRLFFQWVVVSRWGVGRHFFILVSVPWIRYRSNDWLGHVCCLFFYVIHRLIHIWLILVTIIVSILVSLSNFLSYLCFYLISIYRHWISATNLLLSRLIGRIRFSNVGRRVIRINLWFIWCRLRTWRELSRWNSWFIFGRYIVVDSSIWRYLSSSVIKLFFLLLWILKFSRWLSYFLFGILWPLVLQVLVVTPGLFDYSPASGQVDQKIFISNRFVTLFTCFGSRLASS